jgi:hypothetical protein
MAQVHRQEQAKQYTQVVTRSWQDEAFKRRLVADPRAVLQEHGLAVPDGKAVRVVEDTPETMHLVLPNKPIERMSDEQLAQLAGEGPGRKVGQLAIKAWQDEAFKRRLVADPRAVLQEQGLPLPAGKSVRVMENTADTYYLALPAKPAEGELSDEQLEQVAGGALPIGGMIFMGALLGTMALAEWWGE